MTSESIVPLCGSGCVSCGFPLDIIRALGYGKSQQRFVIPLDFMLGFVQHSFFMWVLRRQKESLAARANVAFEMVWRGISRPG
jgi:hypothetical protein